MVSFFLLFKLRPDKLVASMSLHRWVGHRNCIIRQTKLRFQICVIVGHDAGGFFFIIEMKLSESTIVFMAVVVFFQFI